MSWKHLRTDFRSAIGILFAVVVVLCVTPFAIYRFSHGQTLAGVVDLAIVSAIAAGAVHVWRGGNIEHACRVVVVTSSVGCVMVAHLVGQAGVLWMYPVLLSNFMLVDRRLAMLVSVLAIAVLLLLPGVFGDTLERVIFLITAMVVCVFAFILAHRTDSQRAQLEEIARHDALTGAYNRRAMASELAIAIETSRRRQLPCGLAVMDLDYFKHINDNYGHEAGDRVLVDFARRVALGNRKGDRLFRYGGEEFVLLLPGADVGALQASCENLRERIARELRCDGDAITVSIGAAVLRGGEDVASWLARADAAMYQAKRQGRNQVVMDAAPAGADVAPA